jgi:flagellum-specific ATP synthase
MASQFSENFSINPDNIGNLNNYLLKRLQDTISVSESKIICSGYVTKVAGNSIEVKGINSPIGTLCRVCCPSGRTDIEAEVIGFENKRLFLMPFKGTEGLSPGCRVTPKSGTSYGKLSEELIGRVIDGFGDVLDGGPPIKYTSQAALDGVPINPMQRPPIRNILDTGIKAIDTSLTLGLGQRIGLIAGSGVGKSALMAMLARNTSADIVIIGLIGERGREVNEFINSTLGESGLRKSVIIAAPSNSSALERVKAAKLSHLIAEFYRDLGKNVVMLFDSLTRVAHAQREIGLAVGEPPTTKGYTPSVFSLLPNLIERTGMGIDGNGSITCFYTVLAEGDDRNDVIVDIARASLDGQIMLSRQLADKAHYPAIDLTGSISRVANSLLKPEKIRIGQRLRRLWSIYNEKEDLIQIGAYQSNTNPELDEAIRLRPAILQFLAQNEHESIATRNSWNLLEEIVL